MIISRSRYKPVYKKFIRLRKNVQNKKKLSLGFLKKKKWTVLNKFLRIQTLRRKKNFRTYDLTNYFIRKFGSKFKRSFLMNLLNKQSFTLFYGSLKNKHALKIIKVAKKISEKNKTNIDLLSKVEEKLSTVLYRSHFTKSVREARFLINQGHVIVNNCHIYDSHFKTRKGDLIIVSNIIKPVVKYNILSSNMWPIPPDNFIINYNIFTIQIVNSLNLNHLYNKFPFRINIWKLISSLL